MKSPKKANEIKPKNKIDTLPILWGLPIFIIGLAYSSNTVDVVLMPKYIIYSAFSILISLLCFFKFYKNSNDYPNSINNNFFKFYLLYFFISSIGVFSNQYSGDGIFELLKIYLFGSIIFCISSYFFTHEKFIEVIVKSICGFNWTIALIGIVQLLMITNNSSLNHTSSYLIKASFGHKNIFSEMLFMTFPFNVYLILFGTKKWKIASILGTIISLILITILLTRSVWLASGLSMLISLPIWIKYFNLNFEKNYLSRKSLLRIVFLFSFSIVLGVFVYSKLDSFSTLEKQTKSISGYTFGSGAERIELWKKSIKVFKESPILGVGLGNWKIHVLKYGHSGLETVDNKTFHQRPHNDFVWILAEQGILGLLAYLCGVIFMLFSLFQLIKKEEWGTKKFFFFICFYVYLGYLIISIFSFPKERIEHNALLIFIFAIVIIHSQNNKKLEKSHSKIYVVFILLFVINLFAFYVGESRLKSEIHLKKAYMARENGDWENVILEIHNSENKYFLIDPMNTPLSWYSGSAYYNLGNQDKSFNEFYRAYQINPNHIHVLNNLATSFELKGDHESAINLYKKALEISPKFMDAQLNLVASYFNSNKKMEAIDFYSTIDIDSSNQKYLQIMPLVATPVFIHLRDSIELSPLKQQINAIAKDPIWVSKIFVKSKQNKISLKMQIVLDAIFSLDNYDKQVNFEYLKQLRKKYYIKSKQ